MGKTLSRHEELWTRRAQGAPFKGSPWLWGEKVESGSGRLEHVGLELPPCPYFITPVIASVNTSKIETIKLNERDNQPRYR